jgi:hypothetical protein
MAMKGSGGGGYGSRPHVEKSVRTGTGSRGTHPGGVAQLGQHTGDHTTNRPGSSGYRGEPLHQDRSFQPVPFGNEVALNVKGGGPGTGRTIYKTGTQCMTGAPDRGNGRSRGHLTCNRDFQTEFRGGSRWRTTVHARVS